MREVVCNVLGDGTQCETALVVMVKQCHWQTLENRREEARAYSNLGSAYHSQRDFDKAISYHTRVLELAQEQGDRAIEMRAYAGLGHAARCMQVGVTI